MLKKGCEDTITEFNLQDNLKENGRKFMEVVAEIKKSGYRTVEPVKTAVQEANR
jgi:DNA-binding winged helix-turn-helix (wHTH) protein